MNLGQLIGELKLKADTLEYVIKTRPVVFLPDYLRQQKVGGKGGNSKTSNAKVYP